MNRIKELYDWLDNRTGIKDHLREALFEKVPGGSRWRYVWGSTLTFTLMIQFITGIFLWMGYAPSGQTAWESVYYIEQMTGGHFLRGLHHWTAQVMTILLVLHLMQVMIDGAYKAPREVNFWFGIILLLLVLGLSLTGYLLPWDQKGYWATKVATDIMGSTPLIGDWLKQVVLGGSDYGHHTLTRFFALHAGILPISVIALTVGHIYLFRRHGIKDKKPHKGEGEFFWPEQVLKDAVACLAVLATILVLHFSFDGAALDPPADPSSNYPARPDWYFLFLFQFLKYFPGHWEVLGAIILPGIVMTIVFLMPIIGKTERGHKFNLGLLFGILVFAGVLTYMAVNSDNNNLTYLNSKRQAHREAELIKDLAAKGIPPDGALSLLQGPKLFSQHCASCHSYDGHDGLRNMDEIVRVGFESTKLGKPPAKAPKNSVEAVLKLMAGEVDMTVDELMDWNEEDAVLILLKPDGKKVASYKKQVEEFAAKEKVSPVQLLKQNKLKMDELKDGDVLRVIRKLDIQSVSLGDKILRPIKREISAPDLKEFASRKYLTQMLHPERFNSDKFFGKTAHAKKSKMQGFLEDEFDGIDEDKDLRADMDKIIKAISAEAKLPAQAAADEYDKADIQAGRELFEEIGCIECHALSGWNPDDYSAPDLTGYGSREWMLGIVHDPAHERFYGKKNDRMPAFGKDEKLTRRQMERIVDWLRGE